MSKKLEELLQQLLEALTEEEDTTSNGMPVGVKDTILVSIEEHRLTYIQAFKAMSDIGLPLEGHCLLASVIELFGYSHINTTNLQPCPEAVSIMASYLVNAGPYLFAKKRSEGIAPPNVTEEAYAMLGLTPENPLGIWGHSKYPSAAEQFKEMRDTTEYRNMLGEYSCIAEELMDMLIQGIREGKGETYRHSMSDNFNSASTDDSDVYGTDTTIVVH